MHVKKLRDLSGLKGKAECARSRKQKNEVESRLGNLESPQDSSFRKEVHDEEM